jgi:diguanylate cyclase (GGDEF)-like protein
MRRQNTLSTEELEDMQRKLAFAEACADPIEFDTLLSRASALLNKWAQADVVTLILPSEQESIEPMLHIFGCQPVLPLAERSIRDESARLLSEMEYVHLPGEAFRMRRGPEVMPLHAPLRDDYMYRFWSQPMEIDGDVVGIVALFGFIDWVLSPRVRRLLGSVTPMLGRAINNAASIETLRQVSDLDAGTGLLNRKGIFSALERECIRATETERPLAVLLIEVEELTMMSGAPAGDALQGALIELFLTSTRAYDQVGRLADGEFVIVLPERDGTNAIELAGELAAAGAALTVDGLPISMHVGVAEHAGASSDQLLVAADEALFEARRQAVLRSAY